MIFIHYSNHTKIQQTLQLTHQCMNTLTNHPATPKTLLENSTSSSSDGEWESFCYQIKRTMTGSEQEKDNVLRRRLLKFFHSFSLEKNRYYVQRRELVFPANSEVHISNNSILLYGIDFLSQAKIEKYFHPFEVAIEYYDDSHCSVSFQSYEKLMKAVYSHMQKTTAMLEDFPSFFEKMTASNEDKLAWREIEPYYEMCFERVLWFRFLTSHDFQNKNQMGQKAMHQTYLIAKDNFFKEIQKSFDDNSSKKRPRNRSDSRSPHSRSDERSRSRDRCMNKSHFASNPQENRCGCYCLSKQLKKFIEFAESKSSCNCQSSSKKPKNNDYQYQNRRNNSDSAEKRYRFNFSDKKKKDRPMEQNLSGRKAETQRMLSSSIQRSEVPRSELSRIIDENIDRNDDSMINSLVHELEKYHFDEEEVKFERHMTSFEKERQRCTQMNRVPQNGFNMDEESIFEIIQEQ